MALHTEHPGQEEGFTLIELVVVVAIIGILVGIGIPAYGGIQHTTRGNSMKANSESLQKTFTITATERGLTFIPAHYNALLQLQGEINEKVYLDADWDPDFEVSSASSHDYATGEVKFCFVTRDKEARQEFQRGAGDDLPQCEDVG